MKKSEFLNIFVCIILLSGFIGCATVPKQPEKVEEIVPEPIKEKLVKVQVEQENLRKSPNGEKMGTASQDESFTFSSRRGNWVEMIHPELGNVWIWAPSVGLETINPLQADFLTGNFDSLSTALGSPTNVNIYSKNIVVYNYANISKKPQTLFGTRSFRNLNLWIERNSRTILKAEIELAPFEGSAEQLLNLLELPPTKSSSSDFERSRYDNRFTGIARLDLDRYKGDFQKFSRATIYKYDPDRWKKYVTINKRAAKQTGQKLDVILSVENKDDKAAFTAVVAEISLFEGTRIIGKYKLGPEATVINPGENTDINFRVLDDSSQLDMARLSVSAKLISMYAIPQIEKIESDL